MMRLMRLFFIRNLSLTHEADVLLIHLVCKREGNLSLQEFDQVLLQDPIITLISKEFISEET